MLRALLLIGCCAALQPVKLPEGFKAPEPKPLQIGDSEIPDLLSGAAALAVRLATGTFVLGWRPCFAEVGGVKLFGSEPGADEYALQFGPLRFRDDSSVLPAARPSKPIIVYEYESSPFCRKVREMCCLLDLEVEYRPVPGARGGAFAKELFAGGKTMVPYMVDENADVAMYESDDICQYLRETYGPAQDAYDPKALWPLTFGPFQLITSTLAAIVRGLPAASGGPTRAPGTRSGSRSSSGATRRRPSCGPCARRLSS